MTENEIEQNIIEKISEPRSYRKSFNEITSKFESLFSEFDPLENCFEIAGYFSEGLGFVASKQKLINDKRINPDWFGEINETNKKKNQDFSGLYVFIHYKTPFYVGISRGVIKRILQHVKGHSHHTSTLAYNIGLIRYELMNNEKHVG